MKLADDLTDMVKAPFVGSLDLAHLFLLVGIVILFCAMWLFILEHIRSAMMEI
jgi:hypothetical protein